MKYPQHIIGKALKHIQLGEMYAFGGVSHKQKCDEVTGREMYQLTLDFIVKQSQNLRPTGVLGRMKSTWDIFGSTSLEHNLQNPDDDYVSTGTKLRIEYMRERNNQNSEHKDVILLTWKRPDRNLEYSWKVNAISRIALEPHHRNFQIRDFMQDALDYVQKDLGHVKVKQISLHNRRDEDCTIDVTNNTHTTTLHNS